MQGKVYIWKGGDKSGDGCVKKPNMKWEQPDKETCPHSLSNINDIGSCVFHQNRT